MAGHIQQYFVAGIDLAAIEIIVIRHANGSGCAVHAEVELVTRRPAGDTHQQLCFLFWLDDESAKQVRIFGGQTNVLIRVGKMKINPQHAGSVGRHMLIDIHQRMEIGGRDVESAVFVSVRLLIMPPNAPIRRSSRLTLRSSPEVVGSRAALR